MQDKFQSVNSVKIFTLEILGLFIKGDHVIHCYMSCDAIRLSIKDNSLSKLSSVARRIYRIFSHAYFHHRKLYEEFEVTCYLLYYVRPRDCTM